VIHTEPTSPFTPLFTRLHSILPSTLPSILPSILSSTLPSILPSILSSTLPSILSSPLLHGPCPCPIQWSTPLPFLLFRLTSSYTLSSIVPHEPLNPLSLLSINTFPLFLFSSFPFSSSLFVFRSVLSHSAY
jgi:hypothetical protein